MNISTEPETLEINLQERTIETLTDNSLPAAQVIKELTNEADAARNYALCFIP